MPARQVDRDFTAESFGVYFRGRQVLKSATARAESGRVTVVLGRNGCGKSTLIRAALGLGRRDYGIVRFAGRAWERPRLSALARLGLFYVPDRGLLSWRRTVDWHLRSLGQFLGEPVDLSAVADLGIEDLRHSKPKTLSTGERRRVELALGLLRKPSCLIADEPLSGVSPKDTRLVAEALRGLAARDCAVLVTGHQVRELLALADRVIWMVAGTTRVLGTPEEAKWHPEFRISYLAGRAVEPRSVGDSDS